MLGRPDFPKLEEEILEYWKKNDIFKKTLEKPSPKGGFVFFEGPPTANGKPGIHHVESRAYKDVIPRFKTMGGYFVERKAGWDTQGLPVEIEVEKQLGISGKPQIESLKKTPRESIAHFNALCKKSVWKYLEDWKALTDRIGFWLDLERPYVTYYNEYIESLWWIVKQVADQGLLYKDYKVVPYCTRCGTPLSSHELAQGYDETEDPSVYIKFKILNPKSKIPTYFLVWTTTPWTLPGNVALAVGEEVDYVKVKTGNENLILAKPLLKVLDGEYEVIEEYKGADLVDWEYEPLYNFVSLKEKAHYVAVADFISTEDGTGIVHTAVMYGIEDFELGQKLGLPKQHLVDLRGEFIPEVKPWKGMFVKDADPKIVKDLEKRGLLYKQETVKHTYPFCWRCKSPLIYYARESWFIKMSALRERLIAENKTINWVPPYIKEGRFGEWLEEVKDWAISRERYWGTPLPIWICEGCGKQKVVGGFNDFPESGSGNTYHILRHGIADQNLLHIVSGQQDAPHHLTKEGEEQVEKAAKKLQKQGVDLIFASPFIRTRETAEIVGKTLDVPVEFDNRLRETEFGEFEGKPIPEYEGFFSKIVDKFNQAPKNAETLTEVARRMHEFIKEIDTKYKGKRILIVGHGDPLWVFEGALRGLSPEGIVELGRTSYIDKGELRKITLRQLSFTEDGLVDPHKPYIDDVVFECECKGTMRRTPEVMDTWFDSGSMPFAQWHYPFENKERIDKGKNYPADYISEAIDQTRGWFYTLLAVATLLKKKAPYKNVICLGLLLDKKGKKMSKSLGNVVDPWEMVKKYGADTVRWYMYIINQPGDQKSFDEKDLDRMVKQNFMILWNVLVFWRLYAPKEIPDPRSQIPGSHVMDEWVLSRLEALTKFVTERLEVYDITAAARAIGDFINELSTWYVRRSRGRFKNGDKEPVVVLGQVLGELAKLMAPFTPFFAEYLYRETGGEKESVHLEDWSRPEKTDEKLLSEMEKVRKAAELGHAIRAEQKVRVRQPLGEVELSAVKIRPELLEILAEELNVKIARVVEKIKERKGFAVRSDAKLTVGLNLEITLELQREGWLREIVRHINELRKEARLTIQDRITVYYKTEDSEIQKLFSDSTEEIKKAGLADAVEEGKTKIGKELLLNGKKVLVGIEKKA